MTAVQMRYSVAQRRITITRPGQPDDVIAMPADWTVYELPLLEDAIENETLSSLSGLVMLTGGLQDVAIILGSPM